MILISFHLRHIFPHCQRSIAIVQSGKWVQQQRPALFLTSTNSIKAIQCNKQQKHGILCSTVDPIAQIQQIRLLTNRSIDTKSAENNQQSRLSLAYLQSILPKRKPQHIDMATYGVDDGPYNMIYYMGGLVIIMLGLAFAFIPFYRMLCEQSSLNGLAQVAVSLDRIVTMEKVEDRLIRVQFNADVPSSMQWHFKPLQDEIYVYPGETALAFFTAYNPTDKPIIGISTYNLTPFQAAYYFNKIQCFCFDEQILEPHEEVDLPVFFYIDPDFVNDPMLEDMEELLLSYTFFESGTQAADLVLPSPFDPTNRPLKEVPLRSRQEERSGQKEPEKAEIQLPAAAGAVAAVHQ